VTRPQVLPQVQTAIDFWNQHKDQAVWGKWNPDWEESYRLKVGDTKGYYTRDGEILTYWDNP
jgi:hypothetical protein